MEFSDELRESVVRKALSGEMTQEAIAKEFGLGRMTVQSWLRKYRALGVEGMDKRERRPQEWTAEERFAALMETHGLSEEELGVWCRRNGLHTHQLEQWRRDATVGSAGNQRSNEQVELRRLRQENQRLRKDLRRKEKALAETSALLVVKKKASPDLGGRRGRLTEKGMRGEVLGLVSKAVQSGCRKSRASELLGLSVRTLQRWEKENMEDRRRGSRAQPANALSEAEREQIRQLLVSPAYRDLSPKQIVPRLADQGIYLASESTLYRILCETRMDRHRQSSRVAAAHGPRSHCARGPNQVWTWDITYLRTSVAGVFFYLYLIVDIYSRKIVGWQVYDRESAECASELVTEACLVEKVERDQLILHSDNGAPMRGATLVVTLQKLGVIPSLSRPSVSNDNAFSEALFRTLKYRPWYPQQPFASLAEARAWIEQFVHWFNHEHLHSAIRFIAPDDRHTGKEQAILAARKKVYQDARDRHPERWSGATRNWEPVAAVYLNRPKQNTQSKTPDGSLRDAA